MRPWTTWFVAAFASLLLLTEGCTHFAEVADRTPVTVSLRSFRTASVQLVPRDLDAEDATDFSQDLTSRIQSAKIFGSVAAPGSAADLVIRVTLVGRKDSGSEELDFVVELIDARAGAVVGSYTVKADSRAEVDLGKGNFDVDSKTTKALTKASGAIVDHLEEIAR